MDNRLQYQFWVSHETWFFFLPIHHRNLLLLIFIILHSFSETNLKITLHPTASYTLTGHGILHRVSFPVTGTCIIDFNGCVLQPCSFSTLHHKHATTVFWLQTGKTFSLNTHWVSWLSLCSRLNKLSNCQLLIQTFLQYAQVICPALSQGGKVAFVKVLTSEKNSEAEQK